MSLSPGDLVYIAGPLASRGLAWQNVRKAVLTGETVMRQGFNPYIPHLMMHFDMITHLNDEGRYREHGLAFVPVCKGMVVFDYAHRHELRGGTLGEVELADGLGIPVWYGVEQFIAATTELLAG